IVRATVVEAELVAEVLGQIAFEASDEAGHRTLGLIAAVAHVADAAAEADHQVLVSDAGMLGAHSGGQSCRHDSAGDRHAVPALVVAVAVAVAVEVAAVGQLVDAELVAADFSLLSLGAKIIYGVEFNGYDRLAFQRARLRPDL